MNAFRLGACLLATLPLLSCGASDLHLDDDGPFVPYSGADFASLYTIYKVDETDVLTILLQRSVDGKRIRQQAHNVSQRADSKSRSTLDLVAAPISTTRIEPGRRKIRVFMRKFPRGRRVPNAYGGQDEVFPTLPRYEVTTLTWDFKPNTMAVLYVLEKKGEGVMVKLIPHGVYDEKKFTALSRMKYRDPWKGLLGGEEVATPLMRDLYSCEVRERKR